MKARFFKHILDFKKPSGTSRGILTQKETWFLVVESDNSVGIGECSPLIGLSIDDFAQYDNKMQWVCDNIHKGLDFMLDNLATFPSIKFGVEMAFLSLKNKKPFTIFDSDFVQNQNPISINGLVWMGTKEDMKTQIIEKIEQGFHCIKLKIGAIDFEQELDLLRYIRTQFSQETIEIRVDANGAFSPKNALQKLDKLSKFNLHSIEQPIAAKQWETMANLCQNTPLPIALDEELIGVPSSQKESLLQTIKPQYIILKPSLLGGITQSNQWIDCASQNQIGWWITSALESNVGLNAIAQYTYTLNNPMPQGLGTGSLYHNNINSPLTIKNGTLCYDKNSDWDFSFFSEAQK